MTIIDTTTKYIETQLKYASMHPADAQLYKHNAFGALELACRILSEQKNYETCMVLEDTWDNEWKNLFYQLYRTED